MDAYHKSIVLGAQAPEEAAPEEEAAAEEDPYDGPIIKPTEAIAEVDIENALVRVCTKIGGQPLGFITNRDALHESAGPQGWMGLVAAFTMGRTMGCIQGNEPELLDRLPLTLPLTLPLSLPLALTLTLINHH